MPRTGGDRAFAAAVPTRDCRANLQARGLQQSLLEILALIEGSHDDPLDERQAHVGRIIRGNCRSIERLQRLQAVSNDRWPPRGNQEQEVVHQSNPAFRAILLPMDHCDYSGAARLLDRSDRLHTLRCRPAAHQKWLEFISTIKMSSRVEKSIDTRSPTIGRSITTLRRPNPN